MFKYAFQSTFRVTRGRGFARAGGLLVGVWGSSYFLCTRKVHLDSAPRLPERTQKQTVVRSQIYLQSEQEEGGIRRLARSVEPDILSGIARYDMAQVARCVSAALGYHTHTDTIV